MDDRGLLLSMAEACAQKHAIKGKAL